MSSYAFPFRQQQPIVTLTLLTPDPTLPASPVRRATLLADTGFSDYLQIDWETFLALGLQHHIIGTINSELADDSSVTDLVASVRVVIPECAVDRVLRCLSNPGYGEELLLVGGSFLKEHQAIIDYSQEQMILSG